MKSVGLISQLLTICLAIAIAFLYVLPTVEEIGQIQTQISEYDVERKKIEDINTTLRAHIATIESVTPDDRRRLATYMPQFLDDVAVMRDIEFIVLASGMEYSQLSYQEDGVASEDSRRSRNGEEQNESTSALGEVAATPHAFTLQVTGGYEELKSLLRNFEQNHYPLEVHKLELSANEEGDMQATMGIVTYTDDVVLVSDN